MQKGYFINDGATVKWWKGKGGMIDYTNQDAVAWWHRLLDRTLSLGIDLTESQLGGGVATMSFGLR